MSRLLSYACAATLFAGLIAVVGCGGGGGESSLGASGTISGRTSQSVSTAPSTPTTVPTTGGLTISLPVVAPNGTTTTQQVTIPSTAIFATVPANSPLFVLNAGSALLNGTFASGVGIGGDLASSLASIPTSGVSLSNLGAFLQNVALPIPPGPNGSRLVITLPQGNVTTRALTVAHTVFDGKFYVDLDSHGNLLITSPLPLTQTGKIPNNGENAVGSDQLCTFGPGNAGRNATLDIDYGNGFKLHQAHAIALDSNNNLSVHFFDLTTDTSAVPQGGVDTVSLKIGNRSGDTSP